jgi:hypothetical protein
MRIPESEEFVAILLALAGELTKISIRARLPRISGGGEHIEFHHYLWREAKRTT